MSERRRLGVNLRRLVEDITRAYPNLARGLIRECIQNGVDAGATEIQIDFDWKQRIFQYHDDGGGMDRGEFERFFVIAESSKDPRRHIGQFGWGKIPFVKAGRYALIETRSDNYHGAMHWQDLEYWPVEERHLDKNGTSITISDVADDIAIDLTTDKVMEAVRERWSSALAKKTVRVIVDGTLVEPQTHEYLHRKRMRRTFPPYGQAKGVLYFAKDVLSDSECGIAVNLFGQTVTRSLFGLSHPRRYRVFGYVDADFLAESKTSDHSRFRHTPEWLAFQREMRRILLGWLRRIDREEWRQLARRDMRRLRSLVQDLDSILIELPELAPALAYVPEEEALRQQLISRKREGKERKRGEPKRKWSRRRARTGAWVPMRTGRYGISVTFDGTKDGPESWLSGTTIVINHQHPAYVRAKEARQVYYHELKCCANELIKLNSPDAIDESLRRVFELQEKFFLKWAEIVPR